MAKTSDQTQVEDNIPDLGAFDELNKRQEDGIDVPIKGPDGRDLGFSIRIAGPDSQVQKRAVDTLTEERLKREDSGPLTADEIRLRQMRGVALSCMGWTPFKLDGKVLPFNEKNAMLLFARHPFIYEQVEARGGRRASFLPPSSAAAAPQSDAG